jgi:putative CocE/NonD family hydrolase
MLVTRKHPAVRAVAPMFASYDVFADVAFPGGIHLSKFTERWAAYNLALDRGAFDEGMAIPLALMGVARNASPRPRPLERMLGMLTRKGEIEGRRTIACLLSRLVRGVRPVERRASDVAVDRSANMDVHVIGQKLVFRDDTGLTDAMADKTIDWLSPHSRRGDATASGAAIYSYSGWRDGAYQHAAIKRFLSMRTPGSKLTLGPWVHTGKLEVPAFDVARESRFDHDAELLAFFDEHLRGRPPVGDGHPVHYFTMVEERWKSAPTWPPPGSTTEVLYLGPGRSLSSVKPDAEGAESTLEDGTSGTGVRSRWRSLLSLAPGDYPDRAQRDARLLYYESAPLLGDTEVTGHPVVTFFLSSSETDAHLFVYLEDVALDGRVSYVTEGQLRLLHRKLGTPETPCETPTPKRSFARKDASPMIPGEVAEVTFDLLPISWLFERGHRIRMALAGADRDHFDVLAPRTLRVHASRQQPSRIELPVMRA